jgi:lipoprotein-releasing system ATP-binding protein
MTLPTLAASATATNNMPELVAQHLSKTFPTRGEPLVVLRDASLTLAAGQNAAILGPSGSGKSTLLFIIGTLDAPSGGSVRLNGTDPFSMSEAQLADFRNRHIGFVFQFHNLLPDFTALENVLFPTAVREGRETPAARARGQGLLERMGLATRIHFPTANLSGGQKQRVAVARALMNGPELVLADEPTGNLDRASAFQVMDLIAEINRDEGTTFLISTHDEKIAALCRRQIVVGDGRVTG